MTQGVGFRTSHKSLRDVCRAQSDTITPSESTLGVGLTHFTAKQKKNTIVFQEKDSQYIWECEHTLTPRGKRGAFGLYETSRFRIPQLVIKNESTLLACFRFFAGSGIQNPSQIAVRCVPSAVRNYNYK